MVDLWRVVIPMLEPFRISSGEVSTKDAILVRLEDGEAFGWGESSSMPGAFYSNETPDTCERELIEHILPALTGRSFPNMLALEQSIAELTESARHDAPTRPFTCGTAVLVWSAVWLRADRAFAGASAYPATSHAGANGLCLRRTRAIA